MRSARDLCGRRGLALHLDGARVCNAAVELGVEVAEITSLFDSVSVCLSKGLGAPAGSLLAGSRDFVAEARRWRKVVGGGMRQIGIIAAAGIHALDHHVDRLEEDHANARRLADGLARMEGIDIDHNAVRTNMLFARVAPGRLEGFVAHCKRHRVLISARGSDPHGHAPGRRCRGRRPHPRRDGPVLRRLSPERREFRHPAADAQSVRTDGNAPFPICPDAGIRASRSALRTTLDTVVRNACRIRVAVSCPRTKAGRATLRSMLIPTNLPRGTARPEGGNDVKAHTRHARRFGRRAAPCRCGLGAIPAGAWNTGESHVEIYECGALLCGRIIALDEPLDADGKEKTDKNNPIRR